MVKRSYLIALRRFRRRRQSLRRGISSWLRFIRPSVLRVPLEAMNEDDAGLSQFELLLRFLVLTHLITASWGSLRKVNLTSAMGVGAFTAVAIRVESHE